MAIAIQIIAVFFVSALLIFLLYKGWSPILTPILMAALLFLISGQNVMEALSGTFLNGFIQIVPMFMLFLIVGSIMGSLIAQSGAAQTIADTLFTVFAQKRDGKGRVVISGVIAMVVCFLCCYGGLNTFCSIFTLLPIVMMLAQKADIPRRLVPALMFAGISTANLGPGSPLPANQMGTAMYQVSLTAAPVLGVIGMVAVFVLILWYIYRSCGKAYDKGERFEMGTYRMPPLRDKEDRPNFILSVIPFLGVFISLIFFHLSTELSLSIGVVLCIICFTPYVYKHAQKTEPEQKPMIIVGTTLVACLTEGSQNGANSFMIVAMAAAFTAAIGASQGMEAIMGWLISLPIPLIIVYSIAVIVFAFISGAPGCMLILAPVFVPLAAQMGISAAGMMRIAVFGQSVLDTLPNNGAIIVTLGIAGIKMKDGYPGIFKTTVIYMFIGTVIVTVLAMLFPGLA